MALYVNGNKVFNSLVVDGDLPEREVDKVYFQTTFTRGTTPLTITLLETANKTSHIKLAGSVWAPGIPTGYTATTGTISDNSFTTTETSDYHWDYVQEFDITCDNDNAVIIYNGELNQASEVSLNVYHIYNLASKTITQNGTYFATDDNADGYSGVTVNVEGGGGLQLHTLLTAGVISNDYDYQTATFEDSIGTDDNYLLMRMLKDGSYRYMYLSKSDIPASGEYAFAFSDVQCAISQTAIRSTYYSGNFRYIYVDIVGSDDLIFPQSE